MPVAILFVPIYASPKVSNHMLLQTILRQQLRTVTL